MRCERFKPSSLTPLYDGAVAWRTLVDWLAGRASAAAIEPGFDDPTSGRMLQFDGIFIAASPHTMPPRLDVRCTLYDGQRLGLRRGTRGRGG